tara:strand:- start:543 stop:908 length:366 start_codon:yes stop_codon:yes gene_type:complete
MKPNDNCWCPIIVRNSRLVKILSYFRPSLGGITLFPFIFLKGEGDDRLINHESIHIAQYKELLVIGFLLLYLWDFIHGLVKYRNYDDAYRSIRFEREAYSFDQDPHYLEYRETFAWKRFKV